MSKVERNFIYSIGYGGKAFNEFIEELNAYNIKYLMDVRSIPYSRYNKDFRKNRLEFLLPKYGIIYVFRGNLLGGKPKDKKFINLYTGKVDYNKLINSPEFKKGINELISFYNKGIKIAIMCSEKDPIKCHRAKLIGTALLKYKIDIDHIVRTKSGKITSKKQSKIMHLLFPYGNKNLFGNNIP